MDEKKADNKIIQVKKQINITEEKLADSRKKLNKIENLEENFSHLNKNINLCVELLNASVKNKNINRKINHMSEENIVGFKKTSSSLIDEKELTKKEIRELNDEMDKLNDEIKELYKDKEKEEKKEEKEEVKEIEE